jgi:CheY-like chemotaxis protein
MTPTRILIVDDNALFIEMAMHVLVAAGYEAQGASGAEEALRCIPVFKPDVILMDIQMPGIDGMALTRQLKADPATRAIVILAYTAFAAKGDDLGLKAAGFDGYIAKPVEVTSLVAQIRFWQEGPASARASHVVWP